MNTNNDSFKCYLEDNQEVFKAWGRFVADEISNQVAKKIYPVPLATFFKLDPTPRVKDISSALAKVGRKNYQDPKMQMTDLVGVRFVVLLAEQIQMVCDVIESAEQWKAVVSKDFEEEIEKTPKVFDYQSKHYELRPTRELSVDKVTVPIGMCCEVQVRSLLQHAYAELVHDNIYKTDGFVPQQAEREVAKSMALMETTDDLFSRTLKMLKDFNRPQETILGQLADLYRKYIGETKVDKKINMLFLQDFKEEIPIDVAEKVQDLLDSKQYIACKVRESAIEMFFFSQPVSLLVYWMVKNLDPDIVQRKWPLPAYIKSFQLICTDLDKQPSTPLY